jgi:hypothetical protein
LKSEGYLIIDLTISEKFRRKTNEAATNIDARNAQSRAACELKHSEKAAFPHILTEKTAFDSSYMRPAFTSAAIQRRNIRSARP